MVFQDKKFLDAEGITHLVRLLDEYPNNQVLGTVIDAIEGELEQKAEKSEIPNVPVQDVQVNGVSVLSDGVANVPIADNQNPGVVCVGSSGASQGITKRSNGLLAIIPANSQKIKTGHADLHSIIPSMQHESVFYGLSKVAGVDLANETVTLGSYPEASKTAIKEMLGVQDGLKVVRLI